MPLGHWIEKLPGQPDPSPYPETADEELRQIAEQFGAGKYAKPESLKIFKACGEDAKIVRE